MLLLTAAILTAAILAYAAYAAGNGLLSIFAD